MSGPRSACDSTRRFADRVENYVRYRPGYPGEIIEVLREEAGLTTQAVVADVGSGTGILSELFLRNGNTVFAVEPNDAMRAAAEEHFGTENRFRSVNGTAEATTLPDRSIEFVAAGQAFHWFDAKRARAEFARILRPEGTVVLIWNTRRSDTPFLRAYEKLLREWGTDYEQIDHRNVEADTIASFFGGKVRRRMLSNEQRFDRRGLEGRLLSSSYTPAEGHPDHQPMLAELEQVFRRHCENGVVHFLYNTEMHWGQLVE